MKYRLTFLHASIFYHVPFSVFHVNLTDELRLTNNWDDFPNQSMGVTEIDGMNEKNEMELTDVSGITIISFYSYRSVFSYRIVWMSWDSSPRKSKTYIK